MEPSDRKRQKLKITVPNGLTVLRILVTPLFVILIIRDLNHYALAVFVLAGVSDGLDGFIARMFNQRSELGAVLDPIADKLLLTAAYVSLGVLKDIPAWLAVVVISRDVVITIGVAVLKFLDIGFDVRPTLISKWTTVTQILTIGVVLLAPEFAGASELLQALYWATVTMTALSGLHYTYLGLGILQAGLGNHTKKDG
jgi:cardiolipin synthase